MVAGKSGDAGYAVNAQYYDVIFPKSMRDALGNSIKGLLSDCKKIAELGAGMYKC